MRPSRKFLRASGRADFAARPGRIELERDRIALLARRAQRLLQRVGTRRRARPGVRRRASSSLRLQVGQHRTVGARGLGSDPFSERRLEGLRLGLRRRHFEQPRLVAPIRGHERERLDRVFRRVEIRNAARVAARRGRRGRSMAPSQAPSTGFDAPRATVATARAASVAPISGRSTCSASTASTLGSRSAAATAAASAPESRRRARSPDWTRGRCAGRIRASAASVSGESTASGTPRSAAVSAASVPGPWPLVTMREVIATRNPAHRQNPGRGKELRVRHHAHGARAFHRSVEDRVGRRRARLDRAPAPSSGRLAARRPASSRAAARSADMKRRASRTAFDVEQDAVGPGIADERVEQFAEADVVGAAERDHRRKSDAERRREVEHRRAHGARLRDQREPSAAARLRPPSSH